MTRRARIEVAPGHVTEERVDADGFHDYVTRYAIRATEPHFLRLRASNGRILAHSEVYASRSNAKRAASAWLVAMSDLEWADVCEVTE